MWGLSAPVLCADAVNVTVSDVKGEPCFILELEELLLTAHLEVPCCTRALVVWLLH
jgi:hypothetical protein